MFGRIKKLLKRLPGIRSLAEKLRKSERRIQELEDETKKQREQLAALAFDLQKSRVACERERSRARQAGRGRLQAAPLVSIVILNRNGRHHLETLAASLRRADFYRRFEIILVDNASSDDSLDFVQGLSEEFDLHIIRNTENRSFSAANNQGAAQAKGSYLLFLNNDTEVTDGWLDELLEAALTKERVGAVGAKLIYPKIPDGCKNAEKSYTVQHAGIGFRDAYRNRTYFVRPYNLKNGEREFGEETEPVECAGVTAAVLLVKKEVFEEVGGFDERYLYGYEDVDLCLKLVQKGYHNYYCPSARVFHWEFGTQGKEEENAVKERRLHNMYVYQGKWQVFLQRRILEEKLAGTHRFSQSPLRVAIAVEHPVNDAQDALAESIRSMERELCAQGYETRYLCADDEKRYEVGRGTDVLLLADAQYDPKKIRDRKNSLVIVTWTREEWCAMRHPLSEFREGIAGQRRSQVNPKKIDIYGAMPDDETKKYWGDYHYALALKRAFENRGYEADVRPYQRWFDDTDSKYAIVLRGNRPWYPREEPHQVTILWNLSHPEDVRIDEYNSFDLVYFASERLKRRMEGKITAKAKTLLQCTDEQVMRYEEKPDKEYELLFIGNSRKVYRDVIRCALPSPYRLTIYGRHWEDYPEAQACVRCDYLDNRVIGQAYHDACIVLNDHWDDMRENGILSNRLFDALAAEAFVISDEMPEIAKTFEGAVVTYRDREDLQKKIDYYMTHREEARACAAQGRAIVLARHTFAHRVDTMLKDMASLRG